MSEHERVQEVFRRAMKLAPQSREDFLRIECGDDLLLRQGVENLILQQGETTGLSNVASSAPASAAPPAPLVGSDSKMGSAPQLDQFQTGDVFAERYRIVSLLGKGGMGVVYRAQDLVLDVPIAIKFVRGSTAELRERMLHEVRLAREVTHPAVCRVYDVGEVDDQLYFTMEYVDGEDLKSLLARIGRLPSDKVIEIANQICAGLASAHGAGVIHRDLKPANIMIDGRGRVRITDFGIAVQESDVVEGTVAGTPAYMAPEQLAGGEVGPYTDLYAVGLILHEAVTGRAVFGGKSFSEIFTLKAARDPEPPSVKTADVDPRLDRVIAEATRRSPANRPSSALAMGASLPGGDPLAMAVEAEITLDPGQVAAATERRRLRRRSLWSLLAVLVVLLAAVLLLADPATMVDEMADLKPPPVLADRADQMVRGLGYENPPGDVSWGFVDNSTAANPLESVLFWYRVRTPRALPSFVSRLLGELSLLEDVEVPEAVTHESLMVMLDHAGQLRYLHAGPAFGSRFAEVALVAEPYDWTGLLSQVRIDGLERVSDETLRLPVFSDDQAWWEVREGASTTRVEAAAVGALPVYLAVESSDAGSDARHQQILRRARLRQAVYWPIYLAVALTGLALGVVNIARERCDLRGAGVLTAFVLVVEVLAAVVGHAGLSHPFSSGSLAVVRGVMAVVISALAVGLCYLGLEPFVRRRRPQNLVAWTRLLSGRVVNRSVGASLLIGAVAGSGLALLSELDRWLLPRFGVDVALGTFGADRLNAVRGPGSLLATALDLVNTAVVGGILLLFLAVLLHRLIGSRWAATALFVALVAAVSTITGGAHLPLSVAVFGVPTAVVVLFVLHRFGLLALVACQLASLLLLAYPLTAVTGTWFAQGGFFALGAVLAMGGLGFLLVWIARGRASRVEASTTS